MQIKASNLPHSVHLNSGHLPLDALPAINKHLKNIGDRVLIGNTSYELISK